MLAATRPVQSAPAAVRSFVCAPWYMKPTVGAAGAIAGSPRWLGASRTPASPIHASGAGQTRRASGPGPSSIDPSGPGPSPNDPSGPGDPSTGPTAASNTYSGQYDGSRAQTFPDEQQVQPTAHGHRAPSSRISQAPSVASTSR